MRYTVIGAALLVALLAGIDVVTEFAREHRVRVVSLVVCVGLLAAAGFQLWQARRGHG
jgi:hypothetical protein